MFRLRLMDYVMLLYVEKKFQFKPGTTLINNHHQWVVSQPMDHRSRSVDKLHTKIVLSQEPYYVLWFIV